MGQFLFGQVWSPVGFYAADIDTSRPDGTDVHQVTSTPDNEIRVEWGSN